MTRRISGLSVVFSRHCGDLIARGKQRAVSLVLEEAPCHSEMESLCLSLAKRHSTTAGKSVIAQLVSEEVLTDAEGKSLKEDVECRAESP